MPQVLPQDTAILDLSFRSSSSRWHFLYLRPLPHQQSSFLPRFLGLDSSSETKYFTMFFRNFMPSYLLYMVRFFFISSASFISSGTYPLIIIPSMSIRGTIVDPPLNFFISANLLLSLSTSYSIRFTPRPLRYSRASLQYGHQEVIYMTTLMSLF